MTDQYDPSEIEPKWQRVWADERAWEVATPAAGAAEIPKSYVLEQLLSPLGYRQYLHGTVMRHPDGGYVVEPVGDGTEALLARMARANCLIVVDEDVTEVAAGGLITVMPLLLGG